MPSLGRQRIRLIDLHVPGLAFTALCLADVRIDVSILQTVWWCGGLGCIMGVAIDVVVGMTMVVTMGVVLDMTMGVAMGVNVSVVFGVVMTIGMVGYSDLRI